MQDSIRALLDTLGADLTFRRVTEGTYNPATGTTGFSTTDDETARVAFVNYKNEEVDGSSIQRGDRKALVSAVDSNGAALSKIPQAEDQFVGEGDTVNVVSVKTLKPNGTLAAYECQCRE